MHHHPTIVREGGELPGVHHAPSKAWQGGGGRNGRQAKVEREGWQKGTACITTMSAYDTEASCKASTPHQARLETRALQIHPDRIHPHALILTVNDFTRL